MVKQIMTAFVLASLLAFACSAGVKGVTDRAMIRAAQLAQIPESEYSKWDKPVVEVMHVARYKPISQTEGYRYCGETAPWLEGKTPESTKIVVHIRVFVRPDEKQLLNDVLTHELLHYIWFEKATTDDAWYQAHPDSEAFVRSLLPADCPAI